MIIVVPGTGDQGCRRRKISVTRARGVGLLSFYEYSDLQYLACPPRVPEHSAETKGMARRQSRAKSKTIAGSKQYSLHRRGTRREQTRQVSLAVFSTPRDQHTTALSHAYGVQHTHTHTHSHPLTPTACACLRDLPPPREMTLSRPRPQRTRLVGGRWRGRIMPCDWWVSPTNHACVQLVGSAVPHVFGHTTNAWSPTTCLECLWGDGQFAPAHASPTCLHSIAEHCPSCQRGNIVIFSGDLSKSGDTASRIKTSFEERNVCSRAHRSCSRRTSLPAKKAILGDPLLRTSFAGDQS